MRFRDYFKDRIYSLVILIVLLVPAVLLMRAYRLETPAIVAVSAIFVIFFISEILIDFSERRSSMIRCWIIPIISTKNILCLRRYPHRASTKEE